MRERTQQEINEIGFRALVSALGREDALRFVDQFSPQRTASTTSKPAEESPLPAFSPDEAHDLILGMHNPTDQASFL